MTTVWRKYMHNKSLLAIATALSLGLASAAFAQSAPDQTGTPNGVSGSQPTDNGEMNAQPSNGNAATEGGPGYAGPTAGPSSGNNVNAGNSSTERGNGPGAHPGRASEQSGSSNMNQ
jgi:hypothetical protein